MSRTTHELSTFLIQTLRLEQYTPATLDPATPLYAGGLNLDSIDVIDLRVAMRARYGVEVPVEGAGALTHESTVGTLLALLGAEASG